MNIRKNDVLEAEVLSLSSEGNGICKIKDFVVFVPNAIPGDKLLIKILKVKKNYAFSKIEKILKPSSNRIKPDCDSRRMGWSVGGQQKNQSIREMHNATVL